MAAVAGLGGPANASTGVALHHMQRAFAEDPGPLSCSDTGGPTALRASHRVLGPVVPAKATTDSPLEELLELAEARGGGGGEGTKQQLRLDTCISSDFRRQLWRKKSA